MYSSMNAAARDNGYTSGLMHYYSKTLGFTSCEQVQARNEAPYPYKWNGVTYKTARACAEANYITVSGLRKRWAKGYTCDDDLKF